MKKRIKTEYFVNEVVSRPISRKEFLRKQEDEAISDCIARAILVKNKTFTISQINKLISARILSPIEYKSKIYFKKDDVVVGIKYISAPPKLFSL